MPVNKYALLRYRIIDKCIRNKYNHYPSKQDLREACEEALYGLGSGRVSDSTIEKDLYAMRNEENLGFLAPIAYSKDHKGYHYEDADYSIDNITLGDEDIEAIKFATATLNQFKNIDAFKNFNFAIDKLMNRVNISDNFDDDQIGNYVQFETAAKQDGTDFLNPLLTAIKTHKTVEFEYKKFGSETTGIYQLDPYLLKEYRNRWYLIGLNRNKKSIATFGLDRIIKVCEIDDMFDVNKEFSIEKFFRNSFGITSYDSEPKKVVSLKLYVLRHDRKQKKSIKTSP